jgi:regulator of protease activity HflC (stomatin/prohibitin superfamily)
MRQQALEMAGQEILTKDKAQLRINFTARYKVEDVVKALLENKEFEKQLYVVLQLALRTLVGRLSFDELMERKEVLSDEILALCAADAAAMGVSLTDCGVKDIILPGDVKDIMNQVLVAEKRAQANIITRREETASTRSLLNTAKLMEDNAMLYKLKEMEYVEKIAEKINTISLSGSGQIVDQLKQIFVKQ